jgi:aryl-alcohol dehydrogenase-like predicted oxidoreductase
MIMEQRKLGPLTVSALGYGCMGLSGIYGDISEADAIAVVRASADLGITLFDTSDVYGPYTNERILGKAVQGIRDRLVISTKFGQETLPDGSRRINGRPDYVRSACDASLQRLGLDHIDLYFQHRVDKTVPIEDTVGAMAGLVKAGKVRHLGLSEASAKTIRRAHAVHPIVAVQTEYSLWSREVETDVLPTLRELGIGFVAYSPLGRGFLTGQVKGPGSLAANDARKMMPRFQGDNLAHNLELIRQVETLAVEHKLSPAQLALAWVLSRGGDIVPIPGSRRIERVKENLAALSLRLDASDIALLDKIAPPGVASGDRYGAAMMATLDD